MQYTAILERIRIQQTENLQQKIITQPKERKNE
jgi:hypothetical protein